MRYGGAKHTSTSTAWKQQERKTVVLSISYSFLHLLALHDVREAVFGVGREYTSRRQWRYPVSSSQPEHRLFVTFAQPVGDRSVVQANHYGNGFAA